MNGAGNGYSFTWSQKQIQNKNDSKIKMLKYTILQVNMLNYYGNSEIGKVRLRCWQGYVVVALAFNSNTW